MPLPAPPRREVRANVKKAMAPKFVIAGRAKARRGALSAQREEVPLGCNLAGPGWITGHSRRKRNCLPEIATSACGLLAMTIQGASRHGIYTAALPACMAVSDRLVEEH